MTSDCDRTKFSNKRSLKSGGTGKPFITKPPPCLNTKECTGDKHNLSDYAHTNKYKAIVVLAEYQKRRDADNT
jgi:hypothetical protein